MATTFAALGTSIIVTIEGVAYSVQNSNNVLPDPRDENVILITSEICPQEEFDALRVDIRDVTGITFETRNELILHLAENFFFSVSQPAETVAFATAAGTANNVLLADNTANAEYNVLFSTGAVGSAPVKSNDNLKFNPSSGNLTVTSVTGDVTGDLTGNVTGDLTGNADTATSATSAQEGTNFVAKTTDDANKPLIVKNAAGDIVGYYDANGFQCIRYRDEYPSGQWNLPTGAAAPDNVAVTLGGVIYNVLAFDGGTTEEKQSNQFEIAHDLALTELNAETLKIEIHAHILPSSNNSGVAKLFVDWAYLPINGVAISQTALEISYTINANELNYHKIGGVEIPKPTGGFHLGDIIFFTLRRTPTGTDTYPDDIYLLQCAMHVPTNDFGSRQRYVK